MGADVLDYQLPESANGVDSLYDEEFDRLMVGLAIEQLGDREATLTVPQQWLRDYLTSVQGGDRATVDEAERYIVYDAVEGFFREEMLGGTREELVYEWRRDNPVKAAVFKRAQAYTRPFYQRRPADSLREPTLAANHPLNSDAWPVRVSYRRFIEVTP